MSLIRSIIGELKFEAGSTKRILDSLPDEQFGWKPHEKSMTLGKLANHVVELTDWVAVVIDTAGFNLVTDHFKRSEATTKTELLQNFERSVAGAVKALEATSEEALQASWTLKRGDITIAEMPKKVALRQMTLNHIVHHRGQLSVYLRLLNVPVPGLYGPSADEK